MAKNPTTTTLPTGGIAPFGLRMLPELRARIEESARGNGRSMNAEITARLDASFQAPPEDDLVEYMKRLQSELATTKLELALVAALGGTLGRMLKEAVHAIEGGETFPPETLAAVRHQAEEGARLGEKYGFDPKKHLAELQDLAAHIVAIPEVSLVERPKSDREPKP